MFNRFAPKFSCSRAGYSRSTRIMALLLAVFIVFTVSIGSYNKAYATGAGGIIAAAGTVAVPVALGVLAVTAGIVVYDEVQASGGVRAFGQKLLDNLHAFVDANAEAPTWDEVYNWLYNLSIGKLKAGTVFDFIKNWLKSLDSDRPEFDIVTPANGEIVYNGRIYTFNPDISAIKLGEGDIVSTYYDNTGVTAVGNVKLHDFGYKIASCSSPVYYSAYNYNGNAWRYYFYSTSPFTYSIWLLDGNVKWSGPTNSAGGSTLGMTYYSASSTITEGGRYSNNADVVSSTFTDSSYTSYSLFTNEVSRQAYYTLYSDMVGVIENDDVIIRNPSILGGGLLSGENNDVITPGMNWELVNGADVTISDGVIDLPSDVSLDWPLEGTLEGIIAQYVSGAITWDEFLKLLGVIGVNPADGYTIVENPAISHPVDTISEPINNPYPKPSTENKPFTFAYDLSNFFPFCLPFDLMMFIECLSADPVTPEFEIGLPDPKNMENLRTTTISLERYDNLAKVCRDFECIVFIFILIVITRNRMIKG